MGEDVRRRVGAYQADFEDAVAVRELPDGRQTERGCCADLFAEVGGRTAGAEEEERGAQVWARGLGAAVDPPKEPGRRGPFLHRESSTLLAHGQRLVS
jgi:hypothetical protein